MKNPLHPALLLPLLPQALLRCRLAPLLGLFAGLSAAGLTAQSAQASTFSVNDVSIVEGNGGTREAVFTVSLLPLCLRPKAVNYSLGGTATAGSDYVALEGASGTVRFDGSQTSQQVRVRINGDTLNEADETVLLNLSPASTGTENCPISDAQGVLTILNDDTARAALSISDATVNESNGFAEATVRLSAAIAEPVTVVVTTANGTVNPAIAPGDYAPLAGTALTFTSGGPLEQRVRVPIVNDSFDEPNETFFLRLSSASNTPIARSQGVVTIVDDDAAPTISIGDITVREDAPPVPTDPLGVRQQVFPVTLRGAIERPVSVTFSTADGTATSPDDYQGGSFRIGFTPGGPKTIFVLMDVKNDDREEGPETFFGILSGATGGAALARTRATATVLDGTLPLKTRPGSAAPSSVRVSASAAGSRTQPVELAFTGAIVAARATKVAHFSLPSTARRRQPKASPAPQVLPASRSGSRRERGVKKIES